MQDLTDRQGGQLERTSEKRRRRRPFVRCRMALYNCHVIQRTSAAVADSAREADSTDMLQANGACTSGGLYVVKRLSPVLLATNNGHVVASTTPSTCTSTKLLNLRERRRAVTHGRISSRVTLSSDQVIKSASSYDRFPKHVPAILHTHKGQRLTAIGSSQPPAHTGMPSK